jgi:hypothetical protein
MELLDKGSRKEALLQTQAADQGSISSENENREVLVE